MRQLRTYFLKVLSGTFWLVLLCIYAVTFQNKSYGQLTNGLLLDYKLNGNYLDSSPNGYHGTGYNGTFVSDGLADPEGALSANGNNTYVQFPNTQELKPGFPITMAVRVKFDYLGGTQIIAATDFGVTTHSGAWLQVSSSHQLVASYGNAGGGFNSITRHGRYVTYQLQPNTWYFVLAVFRGFNDIDVYIDCELQDGYYSGSAQSIGYTDAAGSLCRKRGMLNSPYYLAGDIDYFMYWDRELSPEEIVPICNIADCPGILSIQDNQGCVGTELNYVFELNQDEGFITQVIWTFGDGSTSNSISPTMSYDSTGSFPFTLQVFLENGCIYEVEGNTEIAEIPMTPILPDTITICQGDTYFLDLSDFSDWDQIRDPNGAIINSYSFEQPGIFSFEFIHSCGEVVVPVVVIQTNTSGFLSYIGENPICENSEVSISINDWENIEGSVFFNLDFGNGFGENVTNAIVTHVYSEPGTYLIELSGTILNCEVEESLTLLVEPPLNFELDSVYTFCQGGEVSISFDGFNFPVFDSSGSEIESFTSDTSGTYLFIAQNSCGAVTQEVKTELIHFEPNPYFQEVDFCPIDGSVVIGLASNSYIYTWDTGATTPTISVNSGGNYTVSVIDSSGSCSAEFTFIVTEIQMNTDPIFDEAAIEFCTEGNTLLTPNDLGFSYTFPDGSTGAFYDVQTSGMILVSYTDGCFQYQGSIEVRIEDCLCPVIVPNIFSPNGDGKNDVFKVAFECETPMFDMLIFNRWGRQIFESKNIDIGWNGEIIDNQDNSSDGVYFYLIKYTQYVDEVSYSKSLNGSVTLVR